MALQFTYMHFLTRASIQALSFCLALFAIAPPTMAQRRPQSDNGSDNSLTPTPSPRTQLAISADSYVIAAQDLLYVDVFDVPELTREYRVGLDGLIAIQLLNAPFQAAGTTPKQLCSEIASALQKNNLVNDPRVNISVEESPFHTVTVTGAVKQPVVFPLLQHSRVSDAITAAGGASDSAGDNVAIARGAESLPPVSLRRVLAGDTDSNLQLHPGDTVSVETAPVIYVTGAVNHPGAFPVRDQASQLTVLRALALAENAKSTAVLSKAWIIRRDSKQPQQQTQIAINLKKIVSGKTPDQPLSPNDILFVPESAGKKAALRGAEAAVQAATGVAIFGPRY